LAPSDLSLGNFHMVVQMAMGWENGHLHQFMSGKTFYVEDEDPDFGALGKITTIDYIKIKRLFLMCFQK
jgi:hypothetical protein